MSYILEALKKSEQERQQGNVPGLQTLSPLLLDSVETSRWPYVVIGVLALSLVFVLGWVRPWAPQDKPVENMSIPIAQEEVKMAPANTGAQASVFISETVTARTPPVIAQRSVPIEPSLSLESVPFLRDMPTLMQQGIPDMEFAGHVYTSNPELRSVIVNGRSMAEGEMVVEGLSVEQITTKGVVFSYRGQLFQMPILQDWAFD